MKLDYITAGMGDPRGKPKIYFSCHPAEKEDLLPKLSGDLLDIFGYCVVWYDTEPEASYEKEELTGILDGMQLLVFGVSERFLKEPNRARETEMPYALAHHIPILPILTEPGLEWDFSRICAEVQLVNRVVTDPTATPYADVLKTFLESVLVGKELAEKVRDAFDAYVFLSYRKKDRRHAQRLMHLIHENPQFRDIAIWYDEYLVPGEDFNDAIRAAFDKSGLFALAVTPHLLEPGNYVMEVEFPLARDRKKEKHDMQIVPVEMYEEEKKDPRTNLADLAKSYGEIPPVQDEHDRPGLDTALVDALDQISKKENDGNSRHRFFIGLAYLCGIDVEVNYTRALELITAAADDADDPCDDAAEKLVDMYMTGEGVRRDVQEAVAWQEKLVRRYRAEYEKHYSPDEHRGYGTKTFHALMRLSDLQRELKYRDEALRSAEEALETAGELRDEVGIREVERDTAVIHNRLGGLYRDRRDYPQAMAHYRKALEIYERLAREIGTARARRDLSVSLERTGDLYRKQKETAQAEQSYSRAREIREALAGDRTNPGARRDLSAILVKQGNIRKAERDYDGALKLYREAAETDRVLAAEMKTDWARDDYAVSLMKIGDICRKKGENTEAAEPLEKAVEICSEMAERTNSLRSRKSLATGLEKLTKALAGCGKREKAEPHLTRALRLREELAAETPDDDTRNELAVTYYQYAGFHGDADALRSALEIWTDLGSRRPECRQYADDARRLLQKLTEQNPTG